MDTMTINERLKQLRTENDLTQSELSKKLKIGQTTVAGYEKDHDPNIYNLIAYADFFGCTLDYLAGREDAPLPYALTEQERALLHAFRALSPQTKEYALENMKLLEQKLR